MRRIAKEHGFRCCGKLMISGLLALGTLGTARADETQTNDGVMPIASVWETPEATPSLKLVRASPKLLVLQDEREIDPDPGDLDEDELRRSIEKLRRELQASGEDDDDLAMPADKDADGTKDDDAKDDEAAENDDDSDDEDDGDDNWILDGQDRLTRVENGRFALPSLIAPSTAIASIGNGQVPKGFRDGQPDTARLLPESGDQRNLDDKPWAWTAARWAAPNTFSNPRYFEDRMLERHGHEQCHELQPLISGARFFLTAPAIPYLVTLSHPARCESTLGYYRPGSCVPVLHQRPPLDFRAAVVEGVSLGIGTAIIP